MMIGMKETLELEETITREHDYSKHGGGIYSKTWYRHPTTKRWYLEISPVYNIDGAGKWTSAGTEYAQVMKPYDKIFVDVIPYHVD